MYLLRSTAPPDDMNRSGQEEVTKKTEVMDHKLKQLTNENNYLQDTLKTLKRQQSSQNKPSSASSKIRTIPAPVFDPASADRVRERCQTCTSPHTDRPLKALLSCV